MKPLSFQFVKLILIGLLIPTCLSAQNLDSLLAIWNDASQVEINRLNAIAKIVQNVWHPIHQPDSSIYYSQLQYDLAESSGNKKWMGVALNNLAAAYRSKKDFDKALVYYSQSIKVHEEIDDKRQVAWIHASIGWAYHMQGDSTQSANYYAQGLKVVEEIGDKKYIAQMLIDFGNIYYYQGYYTHAMGYYSQSIKIYEEIEDIEGMARSFSAIGNTHKMLSDYSQAIHYLAQSLKINKEIGNKTPISESLRDIGAIYQAQGDYPQAMDYYSQSLKIYEELGDIEGMARSFNELGIIYEKQGDYAESMDYHFKSLKILEEIKDKQQISRTLVNIGIIYEKQGDYTQAMNYYFRSLKVVVEMGHRERVAKSLSYIGSMYETLGLYHKAISYSTRSLALAQEMRVLEQIEFAAKNLYKSYEATGQYRKALEMHKLHIQMRDSIQREENQRATIRYEYQQEALQDSLAFVQQQSDTKIVFQNQLNQRNQLLYGAIILLLIGGMGFLFFRYRQQIKIRQRQLELAEERHRKEQLVELDEMKTRLYTNITHEFRTPLTVIMGMTDNIQAHEQERNLISRNSEKLLRLINEILDLSKFDHGSMPLEIYQAEIISYLNYLVESFYSMAQEKEISLTFSSEDPSLIMDFDEVKLQHIVYNLLSNALKFADKGDKISVVVRIIEFNNWPNLELKVKDTGPGISLASLAHIFDRFYQVDSSDTRRSEGTGIGLALTKEYVELLRGEISVSSTLGEGSEFTILLPITNEAPITTPEGLVSESGHTFFGAGNLIAEEKASELIVEHEQVAEDLPILLIVEDNQDVATYIQSIVQHDYKIELAENGQIGLKKAIELVPDIIISDVMMPEMDGYTLTEKLKTNELTSHIPIILLTAKAEEEDRLTGLTSGADAYLTKPFNKKEMLVRLDKLTALRQAMQLHYGNLEANSPTPSPTLEDAFILKIRTLIETNLENSEYGISELCEDLSLSRMQVHRKLKALTNQTTSRVIRSIRLQKAKEMLKTTEQTISEIAYDTGFSDPNHFSRVFKEEFGESPSGVRK